MVIQFNRICEKYQTPRLEIIFFQVVFQLHGLGCVIEGLGSTYPILEDSKVSQISWWVEVRLRFSMLVIITINTIIICEKYVISLFGYSFPKRHQLGERFPSIVLPTHHSCLVHTLRTLINFLHLCVPLQSNLQTVYGFYTPPV